MIFQTKTEVSLQNHKNPYSRNHIVCSGTLGGHYIYVSIARMGEYYNFVIIKNTIKFDQEHSGKKCQTYLVSSSEEREFGLKESINFTQSQFLAGYRLNGHHY